MDMSAKLALVVPTFNEGLAIKDLLAHVRQLPGIDRIVLVDASDDAESCDVFQQLADQYKTVETLHFLKSEQAGRAKQMNQGAGISQEDILLFLHCDTRLPIDAVVLIKRVLHTGSRWGRFDVRLDSEQPGIRLVQFMMNIRSRCRRIATGDQAIFIHRELFTEIGGYHPLPLMEDIDLSRRLGAYPPALVKQPVTTSARRWQKRGVIRTIVLMWWLRLAFWLGVNPQRLAVWYDHAR